MKTRLVKIVGAIVVGALVALACGGMASANQADNSTPTTHTAAAQLRQLHDQLAAALQAGDVGTARASVDALRPILTELKSAPLARSAAAQTFRTDDLAAAAQRDLTGLGGVGGDPQAVLTNLLQTLLGALLDLATGLLGGLPLPLPGLPLPLPGGPAPSPGAPSPAPGLPLPLPVPLPNPAPAPAPEPPAAPAPGSPVPIPPIVPAPEPPAAPAPAPEPAPAPPAESGTPASPAAPAPAVPEPAAPVALP